MFERFHLMSTNNYKLSDDGNVLFANRLNEALQPEDVAVWKDFSVW